jgi:hypothetical protein
VNTDDIKGALEFARDSLDRNSGDPCLALEALKYRPEIEQAGLDDLVWSLCSGRWGCSRNDVLGVFEYLQKWIDEQ